MRRVLADRLRRRRPTVVRSTLSDRGRERSVPKRPPRARRCTTIVEQNGIVRDVATSIGFRPTPDDERILREAAQPGESTSETLRRALRLLDHERWLTQFRADADTLKDEDLTFEPDAW
jgi:hypothetical protein